ncbi:MULTISPECIES: HpcH/HpaI aldolase/citrate lyase family protein [unclassified Achromobacter]|uniref:HpcH/HpaI aldolase family protein n=1 Tax=unclassified Achromobacter TaxID=2626865 RepID=UPI0013037887|nr:MULTISPECIES: aldolase/citrate lyase family protein [unclassified Achromobacter]
MANDDLSSLTRNPLKERLARGELAASMSLRISRSHEIGRIAASAGFSTLYVDLEHSVLSLETAAMLCHAAREAGVVPLVRVPGVDAAFIGRVLDGCAMGLILPHIEDASQARAAVAAAMYPPRGGRSMGSGQALLHYRSFPAAQAASALNASLFIAVMVESAAGLGAVDAIAAVDGVDMLFVGAGDLGAELGWADGDDDVVVAVFERVLAAARSHGKFVGAGGIANRPEVMRRVLRLGVRFVSTGTDLGFLASGAARQLAVVTQAHQDASA